MRIFFLVLLFLICWLPTSANENIAKEIAQQVLQSNSVVLTTETNAFYIFTHNDGRGFVIITNSSNPQLLGFSRDSDWDVENFPQILQDWLARCDSMAVAGVRKVKSLHYSDPRSTVTPLLTTKWHQRSPYNDYAPVITEGNIKTVAGCVAIAAAQITYYWWKDNPLATLKDTPIYPYGKAPVTYSIPKGTPNDWEYIKDSYSDDDTKKSRDAAARLCYVLGTTSYLDYGSSTGGHIDVASRSMYSQYNLLSDYLSRKQCSQEQWDSLLYSEVSNGRPVLCSGQGGGGHAFVLDGYDAETDLFHFNFGWGGSGDGYFPVDSSAYSMGGYKDGQSVVYNIHPKNRNISATISLDIRVENNMHIKIDVDNSGTLPAKLSLYSNVNGERICCWHQTASNNGKSTYKINISEIPADDLLDLALYDEYDNLLCTFVEDMSVVDGISSYQAKDSEINYTIGGLRVNKRSVSGLYITNSSNKTFKILK